MYDEFIENLPASQSSTETFLVKGIRLPLYNSNNTITKVIGNYYSKRENFLLFTSASTGKFEGMLEMTKKLQKCAIVVDSSVLETFRSTVGHRLVLSSDELGSQHEFEYLIFYNTPIQFDKFDTKSTHISAFYDYIGLYNPLNYKIYVEKQISGFPDDLSFTVICKYPRKKKVEFVFGTDAGIKHLSVFNSVKCDSSVFSSSLPPPAATAHFKNQEIEVIDKISKNLKADKLFLYEISPEIVLKALEIVDHVVIVYTKSEFEVLGKIYLAIKDMELEIPDFIKKIVN